LESFVEALDCTAANNGLKRRSDTLSNQGEFGFAPEFAFNISIEDHFLDANGTLDSREENVLPPCGQSRRANWESDERDIRDKN
jgi:hypothetical protein